MSDALGIPTRKLTLEMRKAKKEIRKKKKDMKASGDYSRKEIKIEKLRGKAEALHAENVRQGKLGTTEGIQNMQMGGIKYANLVSRIKRLDPTGATSGYNMGPVGAKEVHSPTNFSTNDVNLNQVTDPLAYSKGMTPPNTPPPSANTVKPIKSEAQILFERHGDLKWNQG